MEKQSGGLVIKVLMDNECPGCLSGELGLSLWIEYKGKKVLFDTGQTNLFLKNAQSMGIDFSQTDAIVISHGHYDHTGGLLHVLEIASRARIYLHPKAVQTRFSRKEANAKLIGMPEHMKKSLGNHNLVWTSLPTELMPGMFVTGQVPRMNNFEDQGGAFYLDKECLIPDNITDDQTLFINSDKGLIVVFGCAHAGVVNTLDYISTLTCEDKIYAVIGGMHLLAADSLRISKTIQALEKYQVQQIIPLHCTGRPAVESYKNAFGSKCVCGRYSFCY